MGGEDGDGGVWLALEGPGDTSPRPGAEWLDGLPEKCDPMSSKRKMEGNTGNSKMEWEKTPEGSRSWFCH